MPDPKAALVGVLFHHGSPPYEAGDVAGFTVDHARRLVASGRATYRGVSSAPAPADGADAFSAMTRAELLDYAREHLGLVEAPPATITDDEIRAGLRAQAAADVAAPPPAAETPSAAKTVAAKA